jgi:hypothetical protein
MRDGGQQVIVVQQDTAPAAPRRADAGRVRLSGRDVAGLLLCAEQFAAPYDLLAAALGAQPARLWLEAGQAYAGGQAWWRPERKIRAALASNAGAAHLADAEICWPSLDADPHAGQTWAVEVELTPKPAARTARILAGLLSRPGYARVVYLTAPAARPVVARAARDLTAARQARVAIRDLPASAFLPGVPRR